MTDKLNQERQNAIAAVINCELPYISMALNPPRWDQGGAVGIQVVDMSRPAGTMIFNTPSNINERADFVRHLLTATFQRGADQYHAWFDDIQAWFAYAGRIDGEYRRSRIPVVQTSVPRDRATWMNFARHMMTPGEDPLHTAMRYHYDPQSERIRKHWDDWYIRSVSAYAHAAFDWLFFQGTGKRVWHKLEASPTGRLSTPRLNEDFIDGQNLDKHYRAGVRCRLDAQFIHADYNAAELAALAAISGDESLRAALASDVDFYEALAAHVWGHGPMRSKAKACIIMFIYGGGPRSIAETTGLDSNMISKMITCFIDSFGQAARWMVSVQESARQSGFVDTPIGRRIAVSSPHQAVNYVLQSVAADWHRIAFTLLQEAMSQAIGDGARVIIHQHDAFLVQVPSHEVSRASLLMRHILGKEALVQSASAMGFAAGTLSSQIKIHTCGGRWTV